jgi:hypothetical protein
MAVVMVTAFVTAGSGQPAPSYHVESGAADIEGRFSDEQLGVLEKINRADRGRLERLPQLIVPDVWSLDERAYSPMPRTYAGAAGAPKLLVVHLPGQMFGAYEWGLLVRWGPVSSGARRSPTPPGLFHLNWRSAGRVSTINPDWFLPWYFNFESVEGRALHEYTLPGEPASHECIRLLRRDAMWLFEWGDQWTLDAARSRVLESGTPLLIVGAYDFGAPPPWRSLGWLAQPVSLPEPPHSR